MNFYLILRHLWLLPAQLKLFDSLFRTEILVISLLACVVFHTAGAVAPLWCIDATCTVSTSERLSEREERAEEQTRGRIKEAALGAGLLM